MIALSIAPCWTCHERIEEGEGRPAPRRGCPECGTTPTCERVIGEELTTLDLDALRVEDAESFDALAEAVDLEARASDELLGDVRDERADTIVRGVVIELPLAA